MDLESGFWQSRALTAERSARDWQSSHEDLEAQLSQANRTIRGLNDELDERIIEARCFYKLAVRYGAELGLDRETVLERAKDLQEESAADLGYLTKGQKAAKAEQIEAEKIAKAQAEKEKTIGFKLKKALGLCPS